MAKNSSGFNTTAKKLDGIGRLLRQRLNTDIVEAFHIIEEDTPISQIAHLHLFERWEFNLPNISDSGRYKSAIKNSTSYANEVNDKYKNGSNGSYSPSGGLYHPKGFIGRGLDYLDKELVKNLRLTLSEIVKDFNKWSH